MMADRQTQLDVRTNTIRTEVEAMGGKAKKSVRYPTLDGKTRVTSAHILPAAVIPEDLWQDLLQGKMLG
jgi:hypothetical protein